MSGRHHTHACQTYAEQLSFTRPMGQESTPFPQGPEKSPWAAGIVQAGGKGTPPMVSASPSNRWLALAAATATTAVTVVLLYSLFGGKWRSSPSKRESKIGPLAASVRHKITAKFNPIRFVLRDDSAAHRGHAGVAGSGAQETHFHLEIVSGEFEGVRRMRREQLVHNLLWEELQSGLHYLGVVCRTPAEDERTRG